MPRVSPCAAIVLALLFGSAAIGAATGLSLISTTSSVQIGGTADVMASLPGAQGSTVYLFAATAAGSTTVTVAGKRVVIPGGGTVFQAGSATFINGTVTVTASIPNDSSLLGEKLTWIAVVVNPAGQVIAIAKTGGPIIEDAIC